MLVIFVISNEMRDVGSAVVIAVIADVQGYL